MNILGGLRQAIFPQISSHHDTGIIILMCLSDSLYWGNMLDNGYICGSQSSWHRDPPCPLLCVMRITYLEDGFFWVALGWWTTLLASMGLRKACRSLGKSLLVFRSKPRLLWAILRPVERVEAQHAPEEPHNPSNNSASGTALIWSKTGAMVDGRAKGGHRLQAHYVWVCNLSVGCNPQLGRPCDMIQTPYDCRQSPLQHFLQHPELEVSLESVGLAQ